MRIENEMLSRFNENNSANIDFKQSDISSELDFFFNNVMDTVVEYFSEKENPAGSRYASILCRRAIL